MHDACFTLTLAPHLSLPLGFDICCTIENISHFTKHFTSAFNSSVLLKVYIFGAKYNSVINLVKNVSK